jgi:hypothetical protein
MMRRQPRAVRSSMKTWSVVGLVVAAAAIVAALAVGTASASGSAGVAFSTGASWKTLTNPASAPTGFQQSAFDDSSWVVATAPFGDPDGHTCVGILPSGSWNPTVFPAGNPAHPSTVYLRQTFSLPENAYGLHLLGTVDNDGQVYVNGTLRTSVVSGNCQLDAIDVSVPNSGLNLDGDNLVAVKAVDRGTISFFDMEATYGVVEVGQQPTETQKGVAISPAPTVTITDAEGNPVVGANVTVALQTINGTGTLVGSTLSASTDSGGVATFSNLKVSDVGKYKLVATSDGATTTSGGFLIANQVTPCNGSCKANGSVPNNTTVNASATNATGALAVSVFGGITPPSGVCTGFVPLGVGSFVNILQSGSTLPDFTIVWQLHKSLVRAAGNPGASKFNICLGAEDLLHPNGTGATPWKQKGGANAVEVADADLGVTLFWGILPDCPNKGRPAGPCVLHRSKDNAGNVNVTFFKPAPWDGHMYGG